jgi:hypothetical protein
MVPKFAKRYFLAPTRNNPPEELIRLGNFIPEPNMPDQPINNRIDFGTSHVTLPHEEKGWYYSASDQDDNSGGLWASFLEQVIGASGSAGAAEARSSTVTWTAEKVVTTMFQPSDEYLTSLLAEPKVLKYLTRKKSWFRDTQLYLITGIKVAYGASMVTEFAKKWGVNMQAGVDLTPAGVPGQVGGGFDSNHDGRALDIVEELDAFVLAYQVHRIKYNSKVGITDNVIWDKGAHFTTNVDQLKKIDPSQLDVTFEGVDPEELHYTGSDLEEKEIKDPDGEITSLKN